MLEFALGRPGARRAAAVADCSRARFSAMEGSGRGRHFAAAKDLLDRLGRLRPETRARWGKMNAHQMVCHLNDSFGAAMGDRTTSKDITFPSRTLIKWIALYAPLPWPKGVPTRPEVDQLDRGTRPVEFSHDKAAWAAAIERFAQQPRTFQFPFSPCLRRTHRMGMDALGLPTPQPSPPSIRSVVDIGWGGRTRHETRRLSLTQPDSFR